MITPSDPRSNAYQRRRKNPETIIESDLEGCEPVFHEPTRRPASNRTNRTTKNMNLKQKCMYVTAAILFSSVLLFINFGTVREEHHSEPTKKISRRVAAIAPDIQIDSEPIKHIPQRVAAVTPDIHINPEPIKQIPQRTPNITPLTLTPLNQEILSHAKLVNVEYVDVNDKQHPHMGALDQHGNPDYLHDERALHNDPPPLDMKNKAKLCAKSDGNYKMLTQKVSINKEAHNRANENEHAKPRVKLFCGIYTQESSHGTIPAIRETWGQKCDGFMVASTKTDTALNAVNIPHEGEEEYNNIWQKNRSIWAYIYDNYYEHYDFFHIGGHDLYVIVENLRLYLESEEITLAGMGGEEGTGKGNHQKPLFLGRRFAEKGNTDRIFNSGGSGYTINKAALKSLVVDVFPTCNPHRHTSKEDVMVAECFRNMGIFPYDTRDSKGGERYMPFAPARHLTYKPPPNAASNWYSKYMAFGLKMGLDHCAADSVAFHYIKPDLMRRMHAILYGHCD